jgi:hypothetical protein
VRLFLLPFIRKEKFNEEENNYAACRSYDGDHIGADDGVS